MDPAMGHKHEKVLLGVQAFCASQYRLKGEFVLSLSGPAALRLLADFQLQDDASTLKCIAAFSTELVDIIQAVKERLWGLRNCSIPGASFFSVGGDQKVSDISALQPAACVFLSTCVNVFPHLRYTVGQVLLSTAAMRQKNELAVESGEGQVKAFGPAQSLLDACKRHASTQPAKSAGYLRALRCLLLQDCLGSIESNGVDLGALLQLGSASVGAKLSVDDATTEGSKRELVQVQVQGSSAVRDDVDAVWAAWGVAYLSLRLLCDLLHMPQASTLQMLVDRMGNAAMGKVLFVDARLDAACVAAGEDCVARRAGVLSGGAGAAAEKGASLAASSDGLVGLLDRPFDQATIHLGNNVLPTNRATTATAGEQQGVPSSIFGGSRPMWETKMVQTPTSLANCQRLMQAVLTALPIIVQGEVGCGKSFMIRELAAALGQESTLLELHLDDQTDSKTLIGAYVCSDVPGEFVWHAGVVAQAAVKGSWLVIEDIDRAPLEVIAALAPLLERRRLYLPNRGEEVAVHPSFRLFGTRVISSTTASAATTTCTPDSSIPAPASAQGRKAGSSSSSSSSSDQRLVAAAGVQDLASAMVVPTLRHFAHYFVFATIVVPARSEIELILDSRFPGLLPVVKHKLMHTYELFRRPTHSSKSGVGVGVGESSGAAARARLANAMDEEGSAGAAAADGAEIDAASRAALLRNTRQFTLRDVIKAAGRCGRYSHAFNHTSGMLTEAQRRSLLNEVVDVFGASSRTPEQFSLLAHRLGAAWDVPREEVEAFVVTAQPQWEANAERVVVGRGTVACSPGAALAGEGQQFAFTRHALRTLERVAVCVAMAEPVLLVGETGCGKTTSVQELANMSHRKLVVQNLSLSTDASDLLGGFRPVTVRQLFNPTYVLFVELFQDTFSSSSNSEFLQVTSQLFKKQQWKRLLKAFLKAAENATTKLQQDVTSKSARIARLTAAWNDFSTRVKRFEVNLPRIEFGFAFSFVNGLLVEAMQNGHWVLLDEINLATPETLQGIAGILDGQSLCLTERGDVEPVVRHPDFRIFAAMNPPTDVGKKELPAALRGRFTEIYVSEMTDPLDLASVVSRYLQNISNAPVDEIVKVYLGARSASEDTLVDSAGQRPRYSLRSLTRSLQAAKAFVGLNLRPLNRALFEGFLLNFQTLLGDASRKLMWSFLKDNLHVQGGKELATPPSRPGSKNSRGQWVLVGPFWLRTGGLDCVDWAERDESSGITRFVMTATVEASIRDLSAAVASGVAPVLLQGPTSVGKTTMIEYLAARTGHKCIRINNHEHTDVQEYIGGYVTNAFGQLEFRDGLLVEALRNGHWIILDELNLAPSDVLEALNRLLDDNRELFIPETGETVRPAEGFTLFATQNPPGVYGGRKPLSRAFRNRFLELSICDLPRVEVEEIVTRSCGIPPRFSKMLVDAMVALQLQRQASSVFQGKHGGITTRDLLKWGRRQPRTPLEVAEEGYMLLAEKLRLPEERRAVCQTLCEVCKVQLNPAGLYDESLESENPDAAEGDAKSKVASESGKSMMIGEEGKLRQGRDDLQALRAVQTRLRDGTIQVEGVRGVAITAAMRRMWRLVGRCISHDEPGLLIGDTGSGKTTVCQLFAAHRAQRIRILNCHQSTETADIIGGLRPVRGREAIFTKLCRDLNQCFHLLDAADVPQVLRQDLDVLKEEVFRTEADMAESAPSEELVKRVVDSFARVATELENNAKSAVADAADSAAIGREQPSKRSKVHSSDEKPDLPSAVGGSLVREDPAVSSARVSLSELSKVCTAAWLRYKSLFEWQDGPLVAAMKEGDIFVLDEINLAEDAVVERLNSVLESGRSLTLAEKGGEVSERIIAHPNFKFLATMNPGGDFGKRELSPALRSRFTEMWAPGVNTAQDLELIVAEIIKVSEARGAGGFIAEAAQLATAMVAFMGWLNQRAAQLAVTGIFVSIREVLAWARFVSQSRPISSADAWGAMLHGAHMVLLDGLGLGLAVNRELVRRLREDCVRNLLEACPLAMRDAISLSLEAPAGGQVQIAGGRFQLGAFSIPIGDLPLKASHSNYVLSARSTVTNLYRILRAMQLARPVLLEGPPGVGKSSIVANLAALAGHTLVRINLSEHSEISDLLGTDLPAPTEKGEGEEKEKKNRSSANTPKFVWCDGVFLEAMKAGHWVLLDELNLAPQSVLEGLNACFDHREEVFLPEIGRSFRCPPTFRVFCAQNPMGEGGGRKGLPQSFLTRFSRVFVESMTAEDMCEIASGAFKVSESLGGGGREEAVEEEMTTACASAVETMILDDDNIPQAVQSVQAYSRNMKLNNYVPQMVSFIRCLQDDVVTRQAYGRSGGPWEFNLRDVFRWCELVQNLAHLEVSLPTELEAGVNTSQYLLADAAHALFVSRLREAADREAVCRAFSQVFGFDLAVDLNPEIRTTPQGAFIGAARIAIPKTLYLGGGTKVEAEAVKGCLSRTLETLAHAVTLRWPVLLVGASGRGKRRTLRYLAAICSQRLVEFSATSSTDSTDLLGTFEQASDSRMLYSCIAAAESAVMLLCGAGLPNSAAKTSLASLLAKILSALSLAKSLATEVAEENLFALDAGALLRRKMTALLDNATAAMASLPSIANEASVLLKRAKAELDLCLPRSSGPSSDSRVTRSGFEWVDGVVVRAVEAGHWLLIDNVNLCSASVLDRLNSLLEPEGTLLLTEGGGGRVVRAHPNFRVFLSMDPAYGEISRAMRNRCVELSLLAEPAALMVSEAMHRHIGGCATSGPLGASLLKLHEFMEGPSFPPSFPRQRLFMRLLRSLSSEISAGYNQRDALQRAITCIVPVLSTVALEAPVNNQSREATTGDSMPDTVLAMLQSALPTHVFACLRLLTLVASGADSLAILASVAGLGGSPGAQTQTQTQTAEMKWLSAALKDASHRARGPGSLSCSGSLNTARLDELAALDSSAIRTLLIIQLIRATSVEKPWVFAAVKQFIQFRFGNSESQYEKIGVDFASWHAIIQQSPPFKRFHLRSIDKSNIIGVAVQESAYISQACEDRVHSRLTLASAIATAEYAPEVNDHSQIGGKIADIADKHWKFADVYIFWRMPILVSEADSCASVDRSVVFNALELRSLHALGYALSRDLVAPDTSELRLLLRVFTVLNDVDFLLKRLADFFYEDSHVEGDLEVDAVPFRISSLSAEVLSVVRKLLKRRDGLADTLLRQEAPSPSSTGTIDVRILWEPILVSTRWIGKSAREFAALTKSSHQPSDLQSELLHVGVSLTSTIASFDNAMSEYWRRPVYSEKIRMWKEGGHAAVPSSKDAWELLWNIEALASPPAKEALTAEESIMDIHNDDAGEFTALPSFVEPSVEYGSVGVHAVSHRALPTALLREWVALLSTFYWAHTAEVPISSDSGRKNSLKKDSSLSVERMHPLLAAMKAKFDSAWVLRETGAPASEQRAADIAFLSTRGAEGANSTDAPEQQFYRHSLRQAQQEESESTETALAAIAEPFLIHSILRISDLLAIELTSQDAAEKNESSAETQQPVISRNVQELRDLLRKCLSLALRHSVVDPRTFRELQSLLWSVEAALADTSAVNVSNLKVMARSVLYTLDMRLYQFSARGLTNSSASVDFSYGSRSLKALLDNSNPDLSQDELQAKALAAHRGRQGPRFASSERLATSGVLLLEQPTGLRTVLRHVDVRALSSGVLGAGSISLLTSGVASLTVSTCAAAHKRFLQMLRMLAATARPQQTTSDDPKSTGTGSEIPHTTSRLPLLYRLATDAVWSCRDFYPEETVQAISNVIHAAQGTLASTAEDNFIKRSCKLLAELLFSSGGKKEECCSPALAKLLLSCLKPVFDVLSSEDVWNETTPSHATAVKIARAWVHAGLLQMHLSLPSLPVDPAAKAGIKASLLGMELCSESRRISVAYGLSALRGGVGSTSSVIRGAAAVAQLDEMAANLRARAIHRPSEARPFADIFFELRDATENLGNVEMILGLLDRMENASRNEIRRCAQEELAWQGSASAVFDRACSVSQGQSQGAYLDICSPVLSGLYHVSSGLRQVCGRALVDSEDRNSYNNRPSDPRSLWRSIMQYPTAVSVNIEEGSVTGLTAYVLTDVEELINGREGAIARSGRLLRGAIEAQDKGGNNARMVLPKPGALEAASSGNLLLLALSKVDHYVGGGIIAASDAYSVFNSVLDHFVEGHLRAEDTRRARAQAKASLFRNKVQESSFEANEEKEEKAALRKHFPNHMGGFKDILANARGPEGQLLYDFDEEEEMDAEENAAGDLDNEGGPAAGLLDQEFDEHVTANLVGYHARMVFVHQAREHIARQRLWRRSQGTSVADGTAPLLLREALLHSLQRQSLAAAKSLDWGLGSIIDPSFEGIFRGASMAALATMAAQSAPVGPKVHDASEAMWSSALGASPGSLQDIDVDRDLLLLLLGDTTSGAWRPRNFHLDPAPAEAVRASAALKRLFERATQLLALYPGNELLLQLCRVCLRISDFHVSTPVGRLLAAVQLLYRQAAEWEQFAAKHVSLAEEMTGLASLIGQWREIELGSWDQLLRGKEVEYAQKATSHWCALARVLRSAPSDVDFASEVSEQLNLLRYQAATRTRGPYSWPSLLTQAPYWLLLSAAPEAAKKALAPILNVENAPHGHKESSNDPSTVWGRAALRLHADAEAAAIKPPLTTQEYLQSIFDILDAFLRKCCVGEFPARLHLVRLFALQMEQECLGAKLSADDDASRLRHILAQRRAHLVYGIWNYYAQFLHHVRRFQDGQRDPLMARIKGEVRIGKWDQLSTYALVAHSEKAHNKLNKLIREYQANVLDQPVGLIFRKDLMGDLASEGGDLQGAVEVPGVSSFFPSLQVLSGDSIEKAMTVAVPIQDTAAEHLSALRAEAQARCAEIAKYISPAPAYSHHPADGGADLDRFPKLQRITTLTKKADKYLQELLITAEPAPLSQPSGTASISAEAPAKDSAKLPRSQKAKPPADAMEDGNEEEKGEGEEEEEDSEELSLPLGLRFEGRARYGLHATDLAEDYCAEIFTRIQSLREEGIPKAAKHRAVVDLLSTLKDGCGFSYLRNNLPVELKDTVCMLSVPAPLPCEAAGDLRWAPASPRDSIERGESYFTRCIAELLQLRTQAVAPNAHDISLREIQVMLGLSENMFALQVRLRCGVRAALQDYRQLAASLSGLEETLYNTDKSESADAPRQSPSRAYLLRAGSVILDNLLQLKLLMAAAATAHIADNLEADCAIEPLSVADTRAATKAVSSAVSTQQKLLAVLSEGGSLVLGASTTWGPYELPRGNEEHIDRPLSKAVQAQINKLVEEVDALLCKEAVVAERLVTKDVMGPVLKSVRGLREYLRSSTGASKSSCLTEGQGIEQQPAGEQLDEVGAALASSLVDSCLTAVQRLRAIAAPTGGVPSADAAESTSGGATLDVETVFAGMLGGSAKRDTSSAANADAQSPQQGEASSLHQSLGLSMGAAATLQSHHLSGNLDALNVHFSSLVSRQGKHAAAATSRAVLSTLPLVQRVASAQALLLSDLCAAYKSAGKFSYIVLRVFRVLLAKGLCSAESKDGEGEGGSDGAKMTFQDDVEGTGMGEGQGKTDVSDQIENEEQLAGLKDDKQDSGQSEERKPSEKLKQEDKDKGVEMSQNFEGDMFDLPQEEEQPEDKNEDEDDEAEEDLERELGEADKDDIVDEKQWDSDEDGSTGEEGEGFEKDSKMQGEELEGETHTRGDDKDDKPGDDKKDDEKKKKEKEKEKADADADGMDMDDKQEEGDINEDKGDEKAKPQGVDVRPTEEEEEENEDGDMPAEDEQDRGEEDGDDKGPNADEPEAAAEGGEDLPDDMKIGAEDGGDDENNADNDAEDMEMPEADEQGSQAGSDDEGEGEENMEQDNAEKDEEDEGQLPEQQNAVMSSGGGNDPDEQHKPEEEDASSDEESEDAKDEKDKTKLEKDAADEEHARPAAYGVNAGEDDDGEAVLGTEEAPDGPPPDQADSAGPKGQGSRSKGAGDSGDSTEAGGDDVHDGRKPPPSREREPPNPFKDKGDINKAWHRRLNIAVPQESEENEAEAAPDDAKKDPQQEKPADRNGKGLFEYGKDEEQGDQVLADVPEDQATQLPQGQEKQPETEGEEPAADEQERMQEDEPAEQPKKAPKENKRNRTGTTGEEERESEIKKARSDDDSDNASLDDASDQDEDNEEGEEKITAATEAENDQDREKQMRTNFSFRMGKSELDVSEDEEEELSLALQRATDDFGYMPEGMNRARDLWSRYRAATDTHSMRLCEQLRLVLEPTLATRLQGDYRTGKRINMRRVIGYVASGFRKDKIWLRRTKPAKREYQVMLMIDDSRSMGTAGPLALSALATISNALSKLEVGDLCVCAFAETVRQLHPFGQPFNEEAGARCVSQFLFEQDRTLLGASLSAVAPIFEEAAAGASRASGPSAVCLQICFIISDARLDTDNRARLDAVVRRMAEQNILVVLVILDKNDDPKDSIFNTKSIEFVNDKIVTKSYLDEFPFPYYIAIQRLDALPDVLADALKQWFELIGSQIGLDNA